MATKRLLEIERKFHFDRNRILSGPHHYAQVFKSIKHLKLQRFTDTYFDDREVLSSNGIWVRRRQDCSGTGVMEAKLRIKGDHTRSTFDEITDGESICNLIRRHFPNFPHLKRGANDVGLDSLAHFTTTRRSFLAANKFTVVLDETDFGHSVGEVELMAEDEAEAHGQIDGFMQHHSSFFDCGRGEGDESEEKLAAYLKKFGAGFRKGGET
ncbi:MAG: hypothetical protein Q9203_006956 [Teloschistes exilis]